MTLWLPSKVLETEQKASDWNDRGVGASRRFLHIAYSVHEEEHAWLQAGQHKFWIRFQRSLVDVQWNVRSFLMYLHSNRSRSFLNV